MPCYIDSPQEVCRETIKRGAYEIKLIVSTSKIGVYHEDVDYREVKLSDCEKIVNGIVHDVWVKKWSHDANRYLSEARGYTYMTFDYGSEEPRYSVLTEHKRQRYVMDKTYSEALNTINSFINKFK
jgi:autonomous glycyl radical cofactor GrcA